MLLFARRITLFGAIALAPFACSAPDAKGLFDPGPGNSMRVPGCFERCSSAALRCTLVDAPCDALCSLDAIKAQPDCLDAPCNVEGGSIVDRCLKKAGAALGVIGSRCDCVGGGVSCEDSVCLKGLLCFDPGGPDGAGPPLFPGSCSLRCNPADGERGGCPGGFVCREQVFNDAPLDGDDRYWCER